MWITFTDVKQKDMKTKSIKKASYNDLEELNSVCASLEGTIEKYSHVLDYIPQSIKNEIAKFHEKVIAELESIDE